MPLLLDPKLIVDFIDLWHKDPNTPMPDFKLTPGQSHMLTAFIQEEKWKNEKARQLKKAQYRKERFLKKNVVSMTTEELVTIQSEIKKLSDEFDDCSLNLHLADSTIKKPMGRINDVLIVANRNYVP